MSEKLTCAVDPCASCPYRRDTPPGVWAADEYMKLPAWDEQFAMPGTFLCHSANLGGGNAVCRGWLEVQERNMSVRMACFRIEWDDTNRKPTKVPLYRSGMEACWAGLRGVRKPKAAAQKVIQKLVRPKEFAWKGIAP